jgi:hypothetical protein
MPFDPTKPADNSPLSSTEMRAQLNGLNQAITNAVSTAVVSASSSNSNGVSTLNLSIGNNPPQQYEVQPIADKLDELINALRR